MTRLELNDLLGKAGIDPAGVMVMRHRPTEKRLRDVLPWLAVEHPRTYNAYQSSHGRTVESALARAKYLASFIGHEPGRALFVGLYAVAGHAAVPAGDFWSMPGNAELRELGTRGPQDGHDPLWFDLRPTDVLGTMKGRLVIEWTGIERAWWRWAARNVLPVHAIHEEGILIRRLPAWQTLVLDWNELPLLPASWKNTLAQWRGIYYIHDRQAMLGYVGSAAGSENLLGRWMHYAASGHGGNRLLRGRDPAHFRFSILERVSPDMPVEDVVAIESTWKDRLHSRAPHGLNDN